MSILEKPLRICYIGWGNHIHLRRWAGYFAGSGHCVRILSFSKKAESIPNAKTITLFTAGKRDLLMRLELFFWLNFYRPDICHVHWAGFAPLVPKIRLCRYGVTVWGSDIYYLPRETIANQIKIKHALRDADFITCDSIDLKREITAVIGKSNNISVIQWGVDTKLFKPGLAVDGWRERMSISPNDKVIFSPRSINPIYETETILKAFVLISREHKDVVLIQKYYNADPVRLSYLKKIACEMGIEGRVRWIGELDYNEMPFLYNSADIVVSIPSSDGTPLSLLEAMACGVPPIISDLPSVMEWVEPGKSGIVVPVGNYRALAKAIIYLFGNKEVVRKITENNLHLVRKKASQRIHMAAVEEIYRITARR